MGKPPKPSAGVILPDGLYHIAELKRILRWGRVSFAKARRAGLVILQLGRCSYVRGRDAIAYVEAHAKEEDP